MDEPHFNPVAALLSDVARGQAAAAAAPASPFLTTETEAEAKPLAEVLPDGTIRKTLLWDWGLWDENYWA